MRVLFWSELFSPDIGGVEIWSAQLIRALQARGHECLAVACLGGTPTPLRTDERPELVFVGRLVTEKGCDVAIRAVRDVCRTYPETRLTIVGDGPHRSELEALAAELGVSQAIRFMGWVPPADVSTLLRSAFAVLMPSRWREPFGLVALQAAEVGRPVVASRVGGLAEIVVDRETGILVPPDDSHALSEAICELLASPATAARMGCAARDKRANFNYARFVASYEELYRRLTDRDERVKTMREHGR